MLRLEAFAEMQKDNSKRFRDGEYEYYIKYGEIYVKNYADEDSEGIEALVCCSDKGNYIEVVRPLWETIKDGDEYWTIDFSCDDNVEYYHYNTSINASDSISEKLLMFRTIDEAVEVAKKMLEVVK